MIPPQSGLMATEKLGQERNLKGTRSRSLTASSRSACGLVPPGPCIVVPDGLGYGHIFELVKGKAGGPSYERRRCEAVDASCTANKKYRCYGGLARGDHRCPALSQLCRLEFRASARRFWHRAGTVAGTRKRRTTERAAQSKSTIPLKTST